MGGRGEEVRGNRWNGEEGREGSPWREASLGGGGGGRGEGDGGWGLSEKREERWSGLSG